MDTFGQRLKKALEIRDLKQSDLIRLTGLDRSLISNYISGKYKAKQDNLHIIAKALNISEAWLMGYDIPMERDDIRTNDNMLPSNISPLPKHKKLPMLGTIACGEPIFAEENIDGYISCPDNIDADFCLRCKGDSMIGARIQDGDIVYIRQQPDVENGEIAAVLIDNEATLKRVYKKNESIILQPENPAYEPLIFVREEMNNIRILGKAVCFLSRVR